MIIEGAISLKAAINSNNRKINCVYIDKDKKTKDFNYLRKLCKEKNIDIKELPNEKLKELVTGKSFGGVCANVSPRYTNELTDGDIFLIDGIEDPFNIGYMLRCLYAFGVKNVLLEARDYSKMESQILKSSAGAFDLINICFTERLDEKVAELKNKGYTVYGLKRDDKAKDVFETIFPKPTLFMLGGEKRGLSAKLEKLCDEYLYIPYGSDFRNSLSGVSALDVVATLLYKQRKK